MHSPLRIFLAALLAGAVAVSAEAPRVTQTDLVRTHSAKTAGRGTFDASLGFGYAQDAEFVGKITELETGLQTPVKTTRMMSGSLRISAGLTSFLDVSCLFPLYYDMLETPDGKRDLGIGDLDASLRILYPKPADVRRLFYQSYLFGFGIPTGLDGSGMFLRHASLNKDSSQETFQTADGFLVKPMMLWTLDFGSVAPKFQCRVHANLGGVFSTNTDRSNLVAAGMGIEYTPVPVLNFFVDVSTLSRWTNFENHFVLGSDPFYVSPGMTIQTPVGLYLQFAGDFAPIATNNSDKRTWTPTYGDLKGYRYETAVAPRYGFQCRIGWNGFLTEQDDDHDGLSNDKDRCPRAAEDIDGFADDDGCPDPDNDNDGIRDTLDKCPNSSEDRDGFMDTDGCPDFDNDSDMVADTVDKCPNFTEDRDTFEDADGCPDIDNDRDGIVDSLDRCQGDPEDFDGFSDNDGCPDPDNDQDSIPDLKDKCPRDAETFNGFQDDDGCPDVKPLDKKAELLKAKELTKDQSAMPANQVLSAVRFGVGGADLLPASLPSIDAIAAEMLKYPDVQIEIRGHTDSAGKFDANMALSQKRADAVRLQLLKKGVTSDRIRAVGFGSSVPVADNRTAAGRNENRRIEIVRLK